MAVGIKTSPGIKLRRSVRGGVADTDYANECSMQSHYEPCREVVSLGYFPDEVSLEVGCGSVVSLQRTAKLWGWKKNKNKLSRGGQKREIRFLRSVQSRSVSLFLSVHQVWWKVFSELVESRLNYNLSFTPTPVRFGHDSNPEQKGGGVGK